MAALYSESTNYCQCLLELDDKTTRVYRISRARASRSASNYRARGHAVLPLGPGHWQPAVLSYQPEVASSRSVVVVSPGLRALSDGPVCQNLFSRPGDLVGDKSSKGAESFISS